MIAGMFAGSIVVMVALAVAVVHQRNVTTMLQSTLRDFIVVMEQDVSSHCNDEHSCEPTEILDRLTGMADRLSP